MSEPIRSVVDALAAVQRKISHIGKGGESTEGGRYSFRRIDDVINGLHPLLAEEGVIIAPTAIELLDFQQPVPGRKSESWSMMQVLVTYQIRAAGADDQLEVQALGIGLDNGDKGPGKALSYAYKTAISQLLSIPTDDPSIDAELTPFDEGWWGGWETQEAHDEAFDMLKERSNALPQVWRDELRPFLMKERILNSSGHWATRVTASRAERWIDQLVPVEHKAGTEPFGLEQEVEEGEE